MILGNNKANHEWNKFPIFVNYRHNYCRQRAIWLLDRLGALDLEFKDG